MSKRINPPMEPIRNPPPSGEHVLTLLYTIWAEQHGVVLSDIKITKATEEEIEQRRKKTQQLCDELAGRKRKRKCSKSSK